MNLSNQTVVAVPSLLKINIVIVEKCVSICFLTFYILQAVPPKHPGAQGNFPLLSLSTCLGVLITR